MILIGRNLSPFTRRVALWLAHQGRSVERQELAPVGPDFEELKKQNPVVRVPVLILEDGRRLIESFVICDYLDETAPEGTRLIPVSGPARLDCLNRLALANSTSEKAVALVYERDRRPEDKRWDQWIDRLTGQVEGGLAAMEKAQAAREQLAPRDGGDLATVIACQFIKTTSPSLMAGEAPALDALLTRAMDWPGVPETMPVLPPS
ncbi:MAG: glutathione S-transferase family protein [Pseudomonadota bacterium]